MQAKASGPPGKDSSDMGTALLPDSKRGGQSPPGYDSARPVVAGLEWDGNTLLYCGKQVFEGVPCTLDTVSSQRLAAAAECADQSTAVHDSWCLSASPEHLQRQPSPGPSADLDEVRRDTMGGTPQRPFTMSLP